MNHWLICYLLIGICMAIFQNTIIYDEVLSIISSGIPQNSIIYNCRWRCPGYIHVNLWNHSPKSMHQSKFLSIQAARQIVETPMYSCTLCHIMLSCNVQLHIITTYSYLVGQLEWELTKPQWPMFLWKYDDLFKLTYCSHGKRMSRLWCPYWKQGNVLFKHDKMDFLIENNIQKKQQDTYSMFSTRSCAVQMPTKAMSVKNKDLFILWNRKGNVSK